MVYSQFPTVNVSNIETYFLSEIFWYQMSKTCCCQQPQQVDLNIATKDLYDALSLLNDAYARAASGGAPITAAEIISYNGVSPESQLTGKPVGGTPGPTPPPTFQVTSYGFQSSAEYIAEIYNGYAASFPGSTRRTPKRFSRIYSIGNGLGMALGRMEFVDQLGNIVAAVNYNGIVYLPNNGKTMLKIVSMVLNNAANNIQPE